MDLIIWLQEYYKSCCNGYWEHQHGVKIDTLDNPGWRLDIDIEDTDLEGKPFPVVKIDRDESDWVFCQVQEKKFKGAGGVSNLKEILEIFKKWVISCEETH